MQVIYKYSLKIFESVQEIPLPNVHRILHVGEQDGQLMMWVQLHKDHPIDSFAKIWIYGTGQAIPNADNLAHLGTVQVGTFVWHVFLELGTG